LHTLAGRVVAQPKPSGYLKLSLPFDKYGDHQVSIGSVHLDDAAANDCEFLLRLQTARDTQLGENGRRGRLSSLRKGQHLQARFLLRLSPSISELLGDWPLRVAE